MRLTLDQLKGYTDLELSELDAVDRWYEYNEPLFIDGFGNDFVIETYLFDNIIEVTDMNSGHSDVYTFTWNNIKIMERNYDLNKYSYGGKYKNIGNFE